MEVEEDWSPLSGQLTCNAPSKYAQQREMVSGKDRINEKNCDFPRIKASYNYSYVAELGRSKALERSIVGRS